MITTFTISEEAQTWLKTGERGASSETIFSRLTGLNIRRLGNESTPSDPSDLRRCRLLLEAVPEFAASFVEMKEASGLWPTLVEHWDELCATMNKEAPGWHNVDKCRCPKTYKRMKELGL